MSAVPNPTIALLQSSTLTSVVAQEIERAILAGEHPPGAKLNELALAEQLGVSRGPVREAFRMLEEAGLVRTEKNRGVFVRDVPLDEAVEIYELRAVMEELVGRLLAARAGTAEVKELRALVDGMDRAAKANDAHGYHLLNLNFHDRMVELAGNRKLTAIYRKLIKELSLFRLINLGGQAAMPVSVSEHRQIVKAIAAGDADAAGRGLFKHVMDSRDRTVERHHAQAAVPAARAETET